MSTELEKTVGKNHHASHKGYKHVVNPPAKPSHGKRQKVAKRKPRNSWVFRSA